MTRSTVRIGALQIGVIVLTLATALIHLWLGILQLTLGIMGGVMFVANAAGYVSLVAALYLTLPIDFLIKNRSLVRWALVAFAAVTILGWVAIGDRGLLGYVDKVIEVALIALLVIEARQK